MTEEAKELLDKMNVVHYMKLTGENSNSEGLPISMYDSQIKQCALIVIDEKIESLNSFADYWSLKNGEWYLDEIKKLDKLKTEIEKLWKQHKNSSKTTTRK